MIVAQIGSSLGVVGDQVYAVVVFMSVATTVVAPPLLRWAFRNPAEGSSAGVPAAE